MDVLGQADGDGWTIYNGDSCEVVKGLPDASIDFSMFSPPYLSMYVYSDSIRDMGNCGSADEFYNHFRFLVGELLRVVKPGRIVAVDCMNVPAMKERDGFIGLKDFRGDLIYLFQRAGFIFHSEHCMWKDPLVEATRTKALGLMHKQLCKDSSMSRAGIPQYILGFRKPGKNAEPIAHADGLTSFAGEDAPERGVLSHERWRRYASPVWMDVDFTNTLNAVAGRAASDERHICVAEDSLVLTFSGYKPIDSVCVGELVLTHRGRWRPVVAKSCNGVRPVVDIKAQGVPGLRVTPSHMIYTRRATGRDGGKAHPKAKAMRAIPDWMRADETEGHYVNLPLPPVMESHLDAEEWWAIGRWLGDGHTDTRGGLHISCSYAETEGLVARLGKMAGFVADTGTAAQVRIKDPIGILRAMVSKCGSGASEKVLPGEALSLPTPLASALLDGYLSADGHYVESRGATTATCVSRKLLLGIAMLTQRVRGVVASVFAGRDGGSATIQGRIVNTKKEWCLSIAQKSTWGFIADDGAWKKVRSVTPAGECTVWDIQVAEDESFIAEGCVVHNCPMSLDAIERCLTLWSNPGDVVLDPFNGIGSTGYKSVEMGRKYVGVELKDSYFLQAAKNLQRASSLASQKSILDLAEVA